MIAKHIDHALVETTRPQAYKAWLYWGKKPPNIVRTYIEQYCPGGGVVLDPFVGSGVTALEAADTGRRAIGIDLNPVGLYLAEDLFRPLDLGVFDTAVDGLADVVNRIDESFTTEQGCSRCKQTFTGPAICFHWRGKDLFAVRAECPHCGHRGTYKPTSEDVRRADRFEQEDHVFEDQLWAPDVMLGYSPTDPFIKVGGDAAPMLKEYFTPRNWYALALLRSRMIEVSDSRMRMSLLSMLTTFVHLASKMMMVRASRPDSSSLARQAYWLPEVFMESNPADLLRRAMEHHQGYRAGKEDANDRFEKAKVYRSVEDLLASSEPGVRLICQSVLDMDRRVKDRVPDSSVDYIFTDPPYGGAIQYMEMFTLWSAWLSGPRGPKFDMRYEDEITINDAQGKGTGDYNVLMTAAFRQCYRVLKEGKYMHVTFHSTDVSTFTSIVEAAQTAGFFLQLVNHQPSLRASDKALAQPYGSATGNYYLRFYKPKGRRRELKKGTVSKDVYQRIVTDGVTRILAKRREPTSFTQIMSEIYVDLSKKGVMILGQQAVADLLRSSEDFTVIEAEDGRLWWFTDPSSIPGLEEYPLSERVERAVLAILRRKVKVTFDDVLQEILVNFPNSLTPESGRVLDYLRAYADPIASEPGVWRLKPVAEEAQARSEHSLVIAELAEVGIALGFAVSVGRTERHHAWAGGELVDVEVENPFDPPEVAGSLRHRDRVSQIDLVWFTTEKAYVAFEVENTTTITDGIVRMMNLEEVVRRVIVLPQARKALLERKLREPMLNPDGERNWTYLFYEKVSELLGYARRGVLTVEDFLQALETEAAVEDTGQGRLL